MVWMPYGVVGAWSAVRPSMMICNLCAWDLYEVVSVFRAVRLLWCGGSLECCETSMVKWGPRVL